MATTLELCRDGAIMLVRLNRPERLNAINPEMVRELRALVDAVRADPGVRALVLTGNGRAFSAGADITALTAMAGPPEFLRFVEEIQTTVTAIEDLGFPTIAALNGLAYGGGCELALACDLRVMAADATLGVPEIKIGVLPGAGGTQRLARLLPPAVAKEMIYLGEPLGSEVALRHGLVNLAVPCERVVEVALERARRLAELPPLALRSAKVLVHAAMNADLKTGIEAERQALAFLFGTADREEGMRAFLDKRAPTFAGR